MTTITETLTDVSETPIEGVAVTIQVAGDGGRPLPATYAPDGTLVNRFRTETDNEGVWSVDLPANESLSPAGTAYRIILTGKRVDSTPRYVTVPATAGPHDVADILTDAPGAIAPPALAAHQTDTTDVHGIPDTSALLVADDVGDSVQAHSADLDTLAAGGKPAALQAIDDGRYGPGGQTTYTGELPAGLTWNDDYAVTPSFVETSNGVRIGSIGQTPQALFDAVSSARSNPSNTYYVSGSGDDGDDGSEGSPFRTIRKAMQQVNTDMPANGATIYLDFTDPDAFSADNAFEDASNYTTPNYDVAIIAINGRGNVGPWLELGTPSLDGTYTSCYAVTYTATSKPPIRVLDREVTDANGIMREIVAASSAAICNATPGTYFYDSGNTELLIHRHDGKAVTDANTIAVLHRITFRFDSLINVYLEGIDFVGGRGGGFTLSHPTGQSTEKALVAVDCTFNYMGGATGSSNTSANGVSLNRWLGLVAFFGCSANGNWKDGFNYIQNTPSYDTYTLNVNCRAIDNGREDDNTSCNGLTGHQGCVMVDIAGRYVKGRGGTVRNIDDTLCYMLGTVVVADEGDLKNGGSLPPTAIHADDDAVMWADRVAIDQPVGFAWFATVDATINRKQCAPVVQADGGTGTYATF